MGFGVDYYSDAGGWFGCFGIRFVLGCLLVNGVVCFVVALL